MAADKEEARVRLADLYRLSVSLMDAERWHEAADVLERTVQLSEDMSDQFFLSEVRFRKAFCFKKLGMQTDLLKETKKISAEDRFFIGDKALGIRDLD